MCGLCEASGWDVPREELPWLNDTQSIPVDPPKVVPGVTPDKCPFCGSSIEIITNAVFGMDDYDTRTYQWECPNGHFGFPNDEAGHTTGSKMVIPHSQDWNSLFLEALDIIKELWWRLESLEMNADVNHQRTTRLRNDAKRHLKDLQDKSGVK